MRVSRTVATVFGGAALLMASACAANESAAPNTGSAGDPMTSTATAASGEFGAACAAVPKDGPGSFQGMAMDPVATAASNNPVLSTLVAAVQQAGLVDTLNSAKDITVFAPTNEAFAKIPPETLNQVLADKAALTKILTYHVVGKSVAPSDLSAGSFETLEKDKVSTAGSGQDYTVNDAKVVCGNVKTANATVYLIDSVLMPPAA
ncbi:fasciclin domain-containing protein [Actinophytocola sp.]|uniref:fasciclin domain-containing protein n=1 Tax=Actinophytocola sp. TaxID=1872138 RepID=UPI002D7F5F41|nr:fasciclin domain-containing protein [Actinophytocola sp.]HET9142633.1 fasciclin domain-containing protein [Actinophytocola sp.]